MQFMELPPDDQLKDIVERVVRQMTTSRTSLLEKTSPSDDSYHHKVDLPPSRGSGPISLGADHGGFELKETLKKYLFEAGYTVLDCGTHSHESVDYPDIARVVAQLVSAGKAWRGIMIDGAGIGSCMAANKIPGVRASMCYDQATANNAREHNDANVLTLGAGLISPHLAIRIVDTWLTTAFGGGRHARRIDKIIALDNKH